MSKKTAKKPMTKKAIRALKGSIGKWEKLASGEGEDYGGNNCALCKAFPECDNCPVAMKTGNDQCRGTPYYDWRREATAHVTWFASMRYTPDSSQARRQARRMLNFLKRLLPKEERK